MCAYSPEIPPGPPEVNVEAPAIACEPEEPAPPWLTVEAAATNGHKYFSFVDNNNS